MARRHVLIGIALGTVLIVVWKASSGFNFLDQGRQRQVQLKRNVATDNSAQQNQGAKASTQVGLEPQAIGKPPDPVSGNASTGGQRSNSPRRVIVVSYIRSGSTFTGDLFQLSPDVFYLYEPLLYTLDVDVLLPNTPIRERLNPHYKGDESDAPETEDYLTSMLSCNITVRRMHFLEGISRSEPTRAFQQCKSRRPSDINSCLGELLNRCHKSQTVLAKVLRLRMWEVERYLSRDPILKVIHLVRDPRGMMASRLGSTPGMKVRSYNFCMRLKDDADYSPTLTKKFPGRMMTVRYEDLATRPIETTKILYEFTGIEWTSKISDQVLKRTNPKDKNFSEHIFGTMRKNSTLTAMQWRKKMDFATAKGIQDNCEKPMSRYGYIPFASAADMLNDSLPAITQDYSDDYNKALAGK